jgi:ABC-type amino acid transport substrate-binding protein
MGQPDAEQEVQIDAIFGPAPILQEAVKSDLPVKLASQAQNVGLQPLAIAVVSQDGLKTDRLISEINRILTRLQRQGTLAEIYLRWYEQDFSQPPHQ